MVWQPIPPPTSEPSGTRVLTQLDQTQPGQFKLPIVDLYPLPPSDPAGLATFYLVIAATLLGFTTMFQLRANVKTLSLPRWLGCVAALAVIGGAALAFVIGPVLHALTAPFPELWLLVSLQIGIAATFNSAMLVLMHRWAIIPTWIVFILLGNTSSGGAVSASLLPQPFAFLNHALPSGSTVSAIHTAAYFPHNQRALPFIVAVPAGWTLMMLLCGLGLAAYYMLSHVPSLRATLPHWLLADGLWFGIQPISAGVFGVPAGLVSAALVSWLTRPPPLRPPVRLEM